MVESPSEPPVAESRTLRSHGPIEAVGYVVLEDFPTQAHCKMCGPSSGSPTLFLLCTVPLLLSGSHVL